MGFNATVFAYGPTGTGKTYTMLGNQEVYGLKYFIFYLAFWQLKTSFIEFKMMTITNMKF